jgi:hypothetical protein
MVDLRELSCKDGRWMELAQDRVHLQALVLAVLNLRVGHCSLYPGCFYWFQLFGWKRLYRKPA